MSRAPDLTGWTKEEIRGVLALARQPVSLAIVGSENEFNIGGIIRIGHNFLVKAIHLVEVEWFYKKGALSTLPYEKDNIHRWETLDLFLEHTAQQPIVALERRETLDSRDLRGFSYPTDPILFFGSEKAGVPDRVLERAQDVVSIPMLGLNNDHNVTVACGIVVYDWYKKHTTTWRNPYR